MDPSRNLTLVPPPRVATCRTVLVTNQFSIFIRGRSIRSVQQQLSFPADNEQPLIANLVRIFPDGTVQTLHLEAASRKKSLQFGDRMQKVRCRTGLNRAITYEGVLGAQPAGFGVIRRFAQHVHVVNLVPPSGRKLRHQGFRGQPRVQDKPCAALETMVQRPQEVGRRVVIRIAETVSETEGAIELFRAARFIQCVHVGTDPINGEAGSSRAPSCFGDGFLRKIYTRHLISTAAQLN